MLIARRIGLFCSHYRIARGYTGRWNAASIAWGWARLLNATHGANGNDGR